LQAIFAIFTVEGEPAVPLATTVTAVTTVVLFSIDGMRPDGLQQAQTPAIDALIARGAHTLAAQTVMPSVTLPCHTSMLRGVVPERHGITDNVWTPMARPVPSVIDLIALANRPAASFYCWEQLRDLSMPGALDESYYINYSANADLDVDGVVAEAAIRYLRRKRPAFMFVYLGVTDEVGHRYGWMSPEYLDAIGLADRALGQVCATIDELGYGDTTTYIVQSDHGGHGQTHGTSMPEDMTIPWIVSGAAVRRGHTIERAVHITDTAATIAHLLGIAPHRDWTGRVVAEAFEGI
jgi:predicted AlkP superfamily pyrophosphatase or phosphodiesterase